ncbi:MAG: amino acid adenylation domain-containing protein, partial [Clostridia bacterium]|nr:amino acid adenylation domain-containing protein [Clostridia bacterium]
MFPERRFTPEQIGDALNAVTEKNDALRLRPVYRDGGVFLDVVPFSPRTFETKRFETERDFLLWADEVCNKSVFRSPGMWDAYIIEVGNRTGILNVGHHAMSDGLNVPVLYRKLVRTLEGEALEEISYLPHLQAEEAYRASRKFEKDRRFWEEQLRRPFTPMPFEEVSGHTDLSCVNGFFDLGGDTAKKLAAFCEDNDVSESAFLYAAAATAIFRLTGKTGFSLGIPVLGRITQSEMDQLGLFMHIVPMILSVEDKDCLSFVQTVEERVFDLFRHQSFTSRDIEACCSSAEADGAPLYDFIVDYSVYPEDTSFEAHVVYNGYVSVGTELHFLRKGDSVSYVLRVREKAFDERFPTVFSKALRSVIEAFLSSPELRLQRISLLSPEERETVLHEFSAGSVVPVPDKSVYALFEEQAENDPGSVRITDGERTYTFADLRTAAEKTDAFVRTRVGDRKQVIGVLCDRSFEELAAIWGVVRGGNTYLPLSPDFPPERIRLLLEQAGCTLVLAQKKYLSLTEKAASIEGVLASSLSENAPAPAAGPDDPLYVIFTSGSTGVPKGAVVTNRSIVNRVGWMADRYFDKNTMVMLKTPYTFDVSVWEIFGFAMHGFNLHILPPGDHYSMAATLDAIAKGRVTDLHFVPTVFTGFTEYLTAHPGEKDKLNTLKNVFLSGEALRAAQVNAFYALAPEGVKIRNLYGPAECAVDVTFYDCTPEENDPVPIGRPIDNTRIYVLDNYLQPAPVGVTGEICIAGANVGLGYLGKPELTNETFIDDPYGEGKMYLTGDLGYWREDGQLVFVGRNDSQVKLNGQRIEPGEIEAALSAAEGVELAAVKVQKDGERQVLCAYYTGEEKSQADLRSILAVTLPRYMVPNVFIRLEEMPLTSSGKLDRNALPEADLTKLANETEYIPPETEEEEILAEVMAEVLGVERVGRNDGFFDLGGDSIRAIYVASKLHGRGWDISVPELMKGGTLRELAQCLTPGSNIPEPENIPFSDPTLTEEEKKELESRFGDRIENAYPLTPAQEGMYAQCLQSEGKHVYHLQQLLRPEQGDPELTEDRLRAIMQRHPALRTAFVPVRASGRLLQVVWKDRTPALDTVKINTRYDEETVNAYMREDLQRPFDLENDALLRARILRFEDTDVYLFSAHHIVTDGWSMTLLLREVLSDNSETETVPFSRYVKKTGEADATAAKTYWKELLADAAPLPLFGTREKETSVSSVRTMLEDTADEKLSSAVDTLAKKC